MTSFDLYFVVRPTTSYDVEAKQRNWEKHWNEQNFYHDIIVDEKK